LAKGKQTNKQTKKKPNRNNLIREKKERKKNDVEEVELKKK
jgi:hypothetical protein